MDRRAQLSQLLQEYVRKHDGLSGRELGKRIGVSPTTAQLYLGAVSYPKEEVRRNIARMLGITFDELQYRLEGIPMPDRIGVEEICKQIRTMKSTDFNQVFRTVCDRAVGELETHHLPQ